MTAPSTQNTWRKSSYSSSETACVEIALAPAAAQLRDTKAREHGHLDMPAEAWHALLDRL